MTQECFICAKTANRNVWRLIKLRGKYNPTIKRVQRPNLQWMRLSARTAAKLQLPEGTRVKACTKCMKAASQAV